MKKILLVIGLVVCMWKLAHAQGIVIPASQFPQVSVPSNSMRFLMVYPPGGLSANPLLASNATISYSSLVKALELTLTNTSGGGSGNANFTTYPITNVNNVWDRFPFANTNNNATNFTITYANLAAELVAQIGTTRNVLLLGALGGNNDDTAVLQALFNTGGQYYFPPTNYTVSGLWMTNNVQLSGYGATINLKTGTTNRAIFAWPGTTIPVTNVLIQGFRFAGGDYSTANSDPTSRSAGSTNRMGINADVNSVGSVIEDVYFTGLDKGLTLFGHSDGLQVFEKGSIFLHNCEGSSNYFGLYLSTTNSNNSVEYFTPIQMRMHDNTYGAWVNAGNIGILGCDFAENYIGIQLSGSGVNTAHGFINANKINHNNGWAIVCSDVVGQTEQIANNQLLANINGVLLTNAAGIRLEGNQFGAGSEVVVGANSVSGSSKGPNFIVNNSYGGTWSLHTSGFYCLDWQNTTTDQTTNMIHYGNYSYNVLGDHDPYLVDPFQTNLIGSIQLIAIATNGSSIGQIPANVGNGKVSWTNPPSGTIGPSLTTNLVVWTNQPTFAIGHFLITTGTNAAGSLVVADYAAPSSTNYVGITNSPNLVAGMTLVFTGLTNADGAPVFAPTNVWSAGSTPSGLVTNNGTVTVLVPQLNITNNSPAQSENLFATIGGLSIPSTVAFNAGILNIQSKTNGTTSASSALAVGSVLVQGPRGVLSLGTDVQMLSSNALTFTYIWWDTNNVVHMGFNNNETINLMPSSGSITASNFTANGGPISFIPTNNAPVTSVLSASGISLPIGITNVFAGRAQPIVQYYVIDAVTGTPILTLSNETSGVKVRISNGALVFVETNFVVLPVTTTNSVWRLRDESAGTGASVGVLTNWLNGL